MKRTRLRRQSGKRRVVNRTRRAVIASLVEARGPGCELACSPDCRGVADAGHEILSRARGGSIIDPDNILLACNPCNTWCEDHPVEAVDRGLKRWSWQS